MGERHTMSDKSRRLGWRIGLGVAVAAVVSVGAFGIAAAASNEQPSNEPAPTEEHDGPPWAGHDRGDWGGGPWGGAGLFQALEDLNVEDLSHAEIVLATEGGGSTTMLVQKGTVTSVNGTSLAVRSVDGFTETYAVDGRTTVNGDDKIGTVAKDEQVVVLAPEGGANPTARTVLDLTDLGWK
ncbi:hypothetical protein [Actinophytocola xanthii]|uniref:DUF5666 domain-containing protein n=1 Tax=Actinophytocola xanthii TaxID=1912961 RepID=A0A1Q8CQL3_9PSEU|nr:hypothetical protein [Actinophytocola xanthii]OLF16637.1 hypothetical protein BU204_15670 [Actinophytocola xanthii]